MTQAETARALRAEGLSHDQIGERLGGVSRQRVDQILYPEKHRARQAVREEIRAGRLKRPATCSRCHGGGGIEGHHADYARPLDIEWLCLDCHSVSHGVVPCATPTKLTGAPKNEAAVALGLRRWADAGDGEGPADVGARGGAAAWKGKTKAERSAEMRRRQLKRWATKQKREE